MLLFPLDALQFVVVVTLFYQSLDWTKISGAMQPIIRDGVSQTWTVKTLRQQENECQFEDLI